jgi:ABC-type branched-subunit amino acid transport system ATPase component
VLDGVTRQFGALRAIDDISFTVAAREPRAILGANGAGKTTLFNVINGFLSPATGAIRFEGAPLVGLKPHQICRQGIGRTFQVVRAFPRMTVLENVITGAYAGAATDAEA